MAKARRKKGSWFDRWFDRLVSRHPVVVWGGLIVLGVGMVYGAWRNYLVYDRYRHGPPRIARTLHLTLDRAKEGYSYRSSRGSLELNFRDSTALFEVSHIALGSDGVQHALDVLRPGDRLTVELGDEGAEELARAGEGDKVEVLGLSSDREVFLGPAQVLENEGSNAFGLMWVLGLLGIAGIGFGVLIAIPTPSKAKGAQGGSQPTSQGEPTPPGSVAERSAPRRAAPRPAGLTDALLAVLLRKVMGRPLIFWVAIAAAVVAFGWGFVGGGHR